LSSVTGLSGAGKSHALRALEDLGYFCVDNLPVALIPAFADLSLKGRKRRRAAVVVDVREGSELPRFPAVYKRLKKQHGRRMRLVFLEATDDAILRRFSETRRPHPLGAAQSVAEGIGAERRMLLPIRRLADQVVDTEPADGARPAAAHPGINRRCQNRRAADGERGELRVQAWRAR
jgi:UPF0042 nucleotide-binding protein